MRHADLVTLVETAHGANEQEAPEVAALNVVDTISRSAALALFLEEQEQADADEFARTGDILGTHPLLP